MLEDVMKLQAWVMDLMEKLREVKAENKNLKLELCKVQMELSSFSLTFDTDTQSGSLHDRMRKNSKGDEIH